MSAANFMGGADVGSAPKKNVGARALAEAEGVEKNLFDT
jgi:hypothetical protein